MSRKAFQEDIYACRVQCGTPSMSGVSAEGFVGDGLDFWLVINHGVAANLHCVCRCAVAGITPKLGLVSECWRSVIRGGDCVWI